MLQMGQKELGEQLAGITAPVWEDGEQSSLLPVHSLAGDSQPQDEYDEDPSSEVRTVILFDWCHTWCSFKKQTKRRSPRQEKCDD